MGTQRVWAAVVAAAIGVLAAAEGRPPGAGLPTALLVAFLKEAHITRVPAPALLLLCGERGADTVRLARALAAASVPTQVVDDPTQWLPAVRSLGHTAHSVVLDAGCAEARTLLTSANALDMFRGPRRWVLMFSDGHPPGDSPACNYLLEQGAPDGEGLQRCYCRTAALLDSLDVLYDSDVSALCADTKGSAVAVSASRVRKGLQLRLQRAAGWRGLDQGSVELEQQPPPDRRHLAGRRLDFHETVTNVGFVISDMKNLQKHLKEGSGLSNDYLSTFKWDLVHDAVAMLNMTINVTLTNDWGRIATGVPEKGLLGLAARQEVELTGTGYSQILDPVRLKYLHFTNFYAPAGGVMVFRAPPLSYENNVFTLPFPMSLWETSVGMVLLCALLLIVVMRAEGIMMHQGQGDHALHSSSDAILLAIAAVCQQGSPVETRGVPGRIIALMLFLLVLLLYTCYSASIVVLMQRSSTTIRHWSDLTKSQIKVGAVDVPYVWHYMKVDDDPLRQRLLNEKMIDRRDKKRHSYSLAEGVRKVRKDYFCFLGVENHIYAEISRTWQEDEKCGLVAIGQDYVRVFNPHTCITRGSHNVDAFKIMLRRLAERGIWQQRLRKFVRKKPPCVNSEAVFHSVSLTDCRGAFYMFVTTLGVSVLVFLLELVAHRRQQRVQQRTQRARELQGAEAEAHHRKGKVAFGLGGGGGRLLGTRTEADNDWSSAHDLIL